MAKFKIGDEVRILDGSAIPDYTFGWCDRMKEAVGKICKIEGFVDFGDRTGVRLEDMQCTWDERGLELAKVSNKYNNGEIIIGNKFKIGDIVIGNDLADSRYNITRKGWIGKVVDIISNYTIAVEGTNDRGKVSTYWVAPNCFDFYKLETRIIVPDEKSIKDKLEEITSLAQSTSITEEEAMTTFSFKTEEGFRIDKTCNKQIPTITTIVNYLHMIPWGSATCDKSDYDEREGILNAIANAVYDGNFDRVYSKYKAKLKRDYEDSCTCKNCGKSFKTPEEARACEKAHIDRKKAKHENYLIRKEAKRKIAEAEREGKINQVMRELAAKKGR